MGTITTRTNGQELVIHPTMLGMPFPWGYIEHSDGCKTLLRWNPRTRSVCAIPEDGCADHGSIRDMQLPREVSPVSGLLTFGMMITNPM